MRCCEGGTRVGGGGAPYAQAAADPLPYLYSLSPPEMVP